MPILGSGVVTTGVTPVPPERTPHALPYPHMNTQPDHNQPRFGDFGSDVPPERVASERLSLMALFSTITGGLTIIGCCIPAVGLVPLLLGIGGFVGISRSHGAVRGKGLAILGMALGIFSLLISSVLWIGASSAANRIPVYAQAFDPDPAVVRTVLTSSAAADLTDEQVADFQAALAAEGVNSLTIPGGIIGLFSGYGSVNINPEGFDKLRDTAEGTVYPFPAETDTGWVYVMVLMDPNEPLGSGMPGLNDVGLWVSSGKVVWLIGPDSPNPGSPDSNNGQSPPPGETDTGEDAATDDASYEDPEG